MDALINYITFEHIRVLGIIAVGIVALIYTLKNEEQQDVLASLNFKVINTHGQPMVGVNITVSITNGNHGHSPVVSGTTNNKGQFTTVIETNLTNNEHEETSISPLYKATFAIDGYKQQSKAFNLNGGEAIEVNVMLTRTKKQVTLQTPELTEMLHLISN